MMRGDDILLATLLLLFAGGAWALYWWTKNEPEEVSEQPGLAERFGTWWSNLGNGSADKDEPDESSKA
jgi:hypothetical protein